MDPLQRDLLEEVRAGLVSPRHSNEIVRVPERLFHQGQVELARVAHVEEQHVRVCCVDDDRNLGSCVELWKIISSTYNTVFDALTAPLKPDIRVVEGATVTQLITSGLGASYSVYRMRCAIMSELSCIFCSLERTGVAY